ncbi:MAG: hypothetical protein K2X87_02040 [Gemmataceae bacterium]|nr:hypothetical protein [Gemmataceae bacterium]
MLTDTALVSLVGFPEYATIDGRDAKLVLGSGPWSLHGRRAGNPGTVGRFGFEGPLTLAHSLIGADAQDHVIHLNNNPYDLRLANLRVVRVSTYRREDGIVDARNPRRFVATVDLDGRDVVVGTYPTRADAARAFDRERLRLAR